MSQTSAAFKTKFLLAVLPDVPFDGWTDELIQRTAEKLKVPAGTLHMEFPRGIRDLVVWFSTWATDEAVRRMKKKNLASLKVRERITLGVRLRLEVLAPHKEALSAALAFLARPPHSLSATRLVWQAADKIWWAAGDTATDYNHYTKRALLAAVLTSTTLYWLNDDSTRYEKTLRFLDRRIDNVLKIGMKIAQLKSAVKRG